MNKKLTQPKLFLTLFAALAMYSLSAGAASEEKVNREFDVSGGGKLIIDVDFGTINVSTGAANKATVEASRHIDFHDEAAEKEYLSSVPLTVTAEGNTVTVRARSAGYAVHQHWHQTRMDARYVVHMPSNFSADLTTGGGEISAAQLSGNLHAHSGGGDLKLSRLQGAVVASSGGGSIELTGCTGTCDIQTGGGDIVLKDGRGNLRARTGGGAIDVRSQVGDIDVSTGGGELSLDKVDGALVAKTSGGGITASVVGSPVKQIRLESSGGSIELALPSTAAVDIEAKTSAGRVRSDLPVQITKADDEHLNGKVNGGGSPVVLRTSGGDITIKSGSAETASR